MQLNEFKNHVKIRKVMNFRILENKYDFKILPPELM
jgi:hypothetical protein